MPGRLLVLVALVVLAAPHSVRAQPASFGTSPPFAGEAYIGMADDGRTAVAILMGQTEVRAYLCDGETHNVWLLGSRSTFGLQAEAEDGTTLTGMVAGGRVDGLATLPDGTALAYIADRATGIAGLYTVVLGDDGQVSGMESDGRSLVGGIARELEGGAQLLAALIEASDGTRQAIAGVASADAVGEQRWIVQANGSVVGAFQSGSGTGSIKGSVTQRVEMEIEL